MEIKELEIVTPNLEQQIKFYSQMLKLDIIKKTNISASFQIGNSILKLKYREKNTPYHYAINIPANQEQQALTWLKEHVEVLTYKNSEIQYFDFWNASAIHYYDADRNIAYSFEYKDEEFKQCS